MRHWIRDHPVGAFVIVAFGWSWGWDAAFFAFEWWGALPVSIPRVWGPLIAGVIVIWGSEVPLRRWLRRVFEWRVHPAVYLFALMFPLFVTNIQPVLHGLGGGSVWYEPAGPGIHFLFLWIVLNAVLLGGTEELGWRGVVQPNLQTRYSVFTTGLVIGVFWWAWHLPLFFTGDPGYSTELGPFVQYTLFVLGASVVLGALVNVTEGSVLPAMLMHAAVNPAPFLAGAGGIVADSAVVPWLVGVGLWWGVAALLVVTYGRSMSPTTPLRPVRGATD